MGSLNNRVFRQDLIAVLESIRELCAARVPSNLGHYTGSQLRMINRIYELTRNNNDGIQLKTLAGVLQITPAATSEMVETLVKRGALERNVDPNDRRAMALRLTAELENVFKKAEEHLDIILDRFFADIPEEQRETAGVIINKLNTHLNGFIQTENKQ